MSIQIKMSKKLFFEIKRTNECDFTYCYDTESESLTKGAEHFFFKAREWAYKQGYEIVVLAYMIKIYKNGYEVYCTNTTLFDLEMFFKSCEWIIDKGGN